MTDLTITKGATTVTAERLTRLVATHDRVELSTIVNVDNINAWRDIAEDAGDFRRVVHNGGDWTIEDWSTTGTSATVTWDAAAYTPPFVDGTYYITRYAESPNAIGNQIEVRLALSYDTARELTGSALTESATTNEWTFDFYNGTVATERVEEVSDGGNLQLRLRAALEPAQAKVLAESATRSDAVSIESIPDGDDFARDNSAGNRNTVNVSPPPALLTDYFEGAADYVLTNWRLAPTPGGERYLAALDMVRTSPPQTLDLLYASAGAGVPSGGATGGAAAVTGTLK